MTNLLNLQNGSDIRGIALDTDEHQANLKAKEARKIAFGIVRWLKKEEKLQEKWSRNELKIAIGHDSRLSAEELKSGLIEGFLACGIKIIDVGLATTPAMFMATQFDEFACDCGVMITASHLPYYFNGIKIFTGHGGAEKEDIQFILENTKPNSTQVNLGSVEKKEVIFRYGKDLVEKIREGIDSGEAKPLEGFHIVVDAGNGAGGFFVKGVLEQLGAKTEGSQFLDPDGHFPNHIPNPDNQEAMESIRQAVLKQDADLGVIFDTDVDRAAVVDKEGQVLNRNNLIAVLAKIVEEEYPGSGIVTNSPTSSHLKDFITSLGGKQIRYLCGYRNVINKAIELNREGIDVQLAIETSGHAAFKENFFLDDGAYVVAKILMLLPKLKKEQTELSDLIAQLGQPIEAKEIRFKIQAKNIQEYGQQVIDQLVDFIQQQDDMEVDKDNYEGIRGHVTGFLGKGWFLLRMSLHEPLLVLQAENDEVNKNKEVIKKLASFFSKMDQLDQSPMTSYIEENE